MLSVGHTVVGGGYLVHVVMRIGYTADMGEERRRQSEEDDPKLMNGAVFIRLRSASIPTWRRSLGLGVAKIIGSFWLVPCRPEIMNVTSQSSALL